MCRPGGIVAVRDADYAAMTWWPAEPELDRWLELYRARRGPTAASPMPAAGCCRGPSPPGSTRTTIEPVGGHVVLRHADRRGRWAGTWAERTTRTVLAEQLVARRTGRRRTSWTGSARPGCRWAERPTRWFIVPNGELICRA